MPSIDQYTAVLGGTLKETTNKLQWMLKVGASVVSDAKHDWGLSWLHCTDAQRTWSFFMIVIHNYIYWHWHWHLRGEVNVSNKYNAGNGHFRDLQTTANDLKKALGSYAVILIRFDKKHWEQLNWCLGHTQFKFICKQCHNWCDRCINVCILQNKFGS